jgi:hypothetical protein
VVENHQTSWRVVSPSLGHAGVPFVIDELQKYVEQITGTKLPVIWIDAEAKAIADQEGQEHCSRPSDPVH